MLQNADIIGAIFAGGRSSRMQGDAGVPRDKAELMLGSCRLIDQALSRLLPQVSQVIISGCDSYGLDMATAPDVLPGYKGPLAGLHGALMWVAENAPETAGILTVPVDAPFAPKDLAASLLGEEGDLTMPVLAKTSDGLQPTFAYWPLSVLPALSAHLSGGEGEALRRFAGKMNAREVMFSDPIAFTNINTPADLTAAWQHVEEELV